MGRIAVKKRRTDMWYGVRPFKPEVTALQHGDFKDEDLHKLGARTVSGPAIDAAEMGMGR